MNEDRRDNSEPAARFPGSTDVHDNHDTPLPPYPLSEQDQLLVMTRFPEYFNQEFTQKLVEHMARAKKVALAELQK